MKRILLFLAISFFSFSCTLVYGQDLELEESEYAFELFDLPNGELGNHVQAVVQDSFGYIWFGSQFGLHRWDGYQFKTYMNDPLDPTSISSSYVECIYVAKDGSLWVGTWGKGINHFDQEKEEFTSYAHKPDDPFSLSNDFVSDIVQDNEGYLWICTQEGVSKFDPEIERFQRYEQDPNTPGSLSYNKCREIYKDSNGDIWIGTGWAWENNNKGGLNKYNRETDDFTVYKHDPKDPESLIQNEVSALLEDSKGNFWVGSKGDGLHQLNRESGTFTRFQNKGTSEPNLSSPRVLKQDKWHTNFKSAEWHIKFIFEDNKQKIWIGAWGGGLKVYDPSTGKITQFFVDSHVSTIPDNFVWDMFQSRDGTLWCWTAAEGGRLFQIKQKEIVFNHINTFLESQVQSIYLQDSILWMGTNNNGLRLVNLHTGQTEIYFDDPKKTEITGVDPTDDRYYPNREKLFENITNIIEDDGGNIWLGKRWNSVNPGLIRFNPAQGTYTFFKHDPKDPQSLPSNLIADIIIDRQGQIWVATGDGSLSRFMPESNAFKSIRLPLDFPKDLNDGLYYQLKELRSGKIALAGGSVDPALVPFFSFLFDPMANQFSRLELLVEDENYTGHQWITGIDEDPDGNLWIGRRYDLKKLDMKTGRVEVLYPSQFGAILFHSFVFDKNGQIWISGDKMLVYNPENRSSFMFSSDSGIKTMPFFLGAIFRAEDGRIFIGGKGGLQYFDPDRILTRETFRSPNVRITEFNLLAKSQEKDYIQYLSKEFWEKPEIDLKYDENVFSFRFSALNFMDPENNQHEFQLVGYDDNWRKAGRDPVATYVKVPPGTYEFHVRAANLRGAWNSPQSIKVIIHPPWWATWWAYSLYAIALIGFVLMVYRFQLRRRLDQAEAERLREMDSVKTRLYTNITHEFRTPLTVILGMAREALSKPGKSNEKGMKMIIRNANGLLDLVNQMLDLSKLENGKLTLHNIQNDVVGFLSYLSESFQSFAEAKGIQIHFLSDAENLVMDYDPDKLQQVVANLLSNAIKFTPAGGHVYFSLSQYTASANGDSSQQDKSALRIKVRDTGPGIPEEELPHIFDRFYQVDDSETREGGGSGIGLSLTRELVTLMDGEIRVKSRDGKGTEMLVYLPIRRKAMPVKQVSNSLPKTERKANPPSSQKSVVTETKSAGAEAAPTVLIVEDNPDVVEYLSTCLADDYKIRIATDGQEGIEIALDTIPDLIVSDIMMPHKDGYEVCKILKQDERSSHIPIIMLTAKADVESKLTGLEYGADAYLAKPFHKKELLIRIRKLLELRKKLQKHYLSAAGLSEKSRVVRDIPDTQEVEDVFIQKVRDLVIDHMDDFEFSVEQMCREIGMSNSQLHRKLSALTGLSATRFIRYVRLNRAKEYLTETEHSITAIAYDCGFNDPSYFGRVFKKEFGVTPMEWREVRVKELEK
ncbi:MAG: response regulator [Bacteroidetes bacterium]|nr:response regulator [Bacteroidota bacterium]